MFLQLLRKNLKILKRMNIWLIPTTCKSIDCCNRYVLCAWSKYEAEISQWKRDQCHIHSFFRRFSWIKFLFSSERNSPYMKIASICLIDMPYVPFKRHLFENYEKKSQNSQMMVIGLNTRCFNLYVCLFVCYVLSIFKIK